MNRKRIWELDALRGALLIGMIGIHLIYDLVDLFGIVPWVYPRWYDLFKNNYGALFLVLSGVSVTLGSHPVSRGFRVFLGGMACTAVTAGMYVLGFTDRGIIIYFGVLHCLGVCMMLWPLMKHWNSCLTGLAAAAMWWIGMLLRTRGFSFPWLTVLGFAPWGFVSSDYFPLFPSLGYFLLGTLLGKHFYADRQTRFPGGIARFPILQWMGRHSLTIYLLHQPVLALAVGCAAWLMSAAR